jgi:hypothetical protein
MKPKDLTDAVQHNKNVLRELGIVLVTAEKGKYSVALTKKKVRRKNISTGAMEEKEIFFLVSSCGKINFPVDLLLALTDKVSTNLEITQIEYNSKGYIQKITGSFQ